MTYQKFFLVLILIHSFVSAQIRGVVKDSLNGKPIPYVSIWVENETIGTTSEEDGTFFINAAENKILIFSSLGYEKVRQRLSAKKEVLLVPKTVAIEEIIIQPRKGTKTREIGETENTLSEAFDSAPSIDLKYFPYSEAYKKTPYLKKVVMYTDSRIPSATLKLHFYSVDAQGNPGAELLTDEYRVSVKQGVGKSSFNITELGLAMPKNGIYVGFEKLMIEDNRSNGGRFYPLVLYNRLPKDFEFVYTGGKWQKKTLRSDLSSEVKKAYEPAINLILTN